jgi:hypothetical protein
MRKFFTALALAGALLAAPSASAQTVGVPLQVRTGEVYTVRVEQTSSTEVAEQEIEATLTQVYALNIVDAENRIWRYTPVSITYSLPTGMGIEEETASIDWQLLSEGLSAMLRVATDVGVECRVDAYGRCLEMSNWPLWRDRAENLMLMIDAFARMAPQQPASDEASMQPTASTTPEAEPEQTPPPAVKWSELRGPLLRGIARMLDGVDTRDAAAAMASLHAASAVQGRTLTRRQSEAVVDELEMPFGAPPLRFTGTLRLERIDRRNNTATIVRRVALDAESARATLRAVSQFLSANLIEPVAAVSAQEGSPGPSAADLVTMFDALLAAVDFRYEETTTGMVDLATGMARETTTEFTFTMTPPGDGAPAIPAAINGRTVMRITPGAPEVPRLPRD